MINFGAGGKISVANWAHVLLCLYLSLKRLELIAFPKGSTLIQYFVDGFKLLLEPKKEEYIVQK